MQGNNDSVGGYMPPQQAPAAGAEGASEYYYCYEMPDGTIGYIPASEYDQQMYSPAEEQQQQQPEEEEVGGGGNGAQGGPQPAGYVEPTYGQGTAFAPAQQQQYYTTSQMNPRAIPASNVRANAATAAAAAGGGGWSNATNGNPSANPNANYGYYTPDGNYVNSGAVAPAAPSLAQQQLQQQNAYAYAQPQDAAAGAEAMTAAPLPQLPHETGGSGGWYTAPATFGEMRKWDGQQKWSTALSSACFKEPCFCLGACVAPWCVVAAHRRRLLEKDYKQYRCCGGVCGHVDSCECCGDTPRCSLFWEVLFCLPCACHANRYMLMKKYGLRKSCCDTTILGCGCFCAPVHWCGECTCWFPESFWDWLYVLAYPCMLTQHHRELDTQEKGVPESKFTNWQTQA